MLDLNLSNIKVLEPVKGESTHLLQPILEELEAVCKLRRLKLSHINLNHKCLIKCILDIIQSNYKLQYLNLSHCNIQLQDLIAITGEVKRCFEMQYLNLGGNKVTRNGLVPQDVDPSKFRAVRTVKPEQFHKELVQELTDHLCDIIEQQQSTLRVLDISDLGLDSSSNKRVFKSLMKNNSLQSINLGAFNDRDDVVALQKMLNFEYEQAPMFSILSKVKAAVGEADAEIEAGKLTLNTGLVKAVEEQVRLRESTLMATQHKGYCAPGQPLILNRYLSNPELVFSKLRGFDHWHNNTWRQVKECYITAQHRYVQVYLNTDDPSSNDFRIVQNQEKLMSKLDERYADGRMRCPLIIVNDQVNKMINPLIYISLMLVDKIMAEKRN